MNNKALYDRLSREAEATEKLLEATKATTNHMNRIYKNVKYFLENKKTASKQVLEAAIRSVSTVVKDSYLQGCTIEHKDGKTAILNETGQNINLREGSACRASMGFILRYTCIKALPNSMQVMFLDEALATLSADTSLNLKDIIEVFSQDIGIVGIEQRNVLYNGLANKVYVARLNNGVTTIERGVIDG